MRTLYGKGAKNGNSTVSLQLRFLSHAGNLSTIFQWRYLNNREIKESAQTNEGINLTVLCRLYHGSALEYCNVFSVG